VEKRAGTACSKCLLTKYSERYFAAVYLPDLSVAWQMLLVIKTIIIAIKNELTISLAK